MLPPSFRPHRQTAFLTTLAMGVGLSIALASPGHADDDPLLDLTLAGGVVFGPDYEGSDNYELGVVPFIELSAFDGLASISLDGAEAFLPLGENVAVGVGLSYDGGRDEDDNEALDGLGDIDDSFIGSISAIAALDETQVSLTFAHSLGGDVEGYTIDLTVGHEIEVIEDRFDLEFEAGITWASQDYLDIYFGIDADQAAASGLDETDVDAGVKNAALGVTGNYFLTDWIALGLGVEYQRLLGDAADSPIVEVEGSPDQISALAYVAVEFGLF